MKKLICYLLIVWLAVLSGGANAHSITDAAHEAEHAVQVQPSAAEVADSADAAHADACNQSHCGHGHSTALLAPVVAESKFDAFIALPKSSNSWASAGIANNIERPKWPLITPVVVSLLT